MSTVDPSQNLAFDDVSCITNEECWAVGYYQAGYEQTLIEHYADGTWTLVNSPAAWPSSNSVLHGLSCPLPSDCWAVGEADGPSSPTVIIEHYDGSGWTVVRAPSPGTLANSLASVACVTPTNCWAVGEQQDPGLGRALIEHYDGAQWTLGITPNISSRLDDVSCASLTDCWAVGTQTVTCNCAESHTLALHLTDNVWSAVPSPNGSTQDQPNELESVACPAPGVCWATGQTGGWNAVPITPLLEQYRDGSWTFASDPLSGFTSQFGQVRCVNINDCWALASLGRTAVALQFAHGVWNQVALPQLGDDTQLNSISCPSGISCVAVGWWSNPSSQFTLAEHFTAPFENMLSISAAGGVQAVMGSILASMSSQWPQPLGRDIALSHDGGSGYLLDGWGGVHAFGGAAAVRVSMYHAGWNIARALALRPDGHTGYVLDGWGGVHPFGVAGDMPPPVSGGGWWPGWDIARAIALRPDGQSGYVLDGWGGLHPFGTPGDVPARVSGGGWWPGWDIARSIVLRVDGMSGFELDGWGGVHSFGVGDDIPPPAAGHAYWPGKDMARDIALSPGGGNSGWVLDACGGIHAFNGAPAQQALGDCSRPPAQAIAVG